MFRVWAPVVWTMDVETRAGCSPMMRDDAGWWSSDVASPPGTDYRFRPDGGDPLPDPLSPWQPQGVHGPSRTVDHAAFEWTDAGFRPPPLESGLIYELHAGTFTPEGTFDGIVSKLDYLRDLGVTHIELMPVAEFDGARGWGYDGVDLFAPHHDYGGPEGLKRLVNACHGKGLGVILDVVYNHLGPCGNHLARFGPYFNPDHSTPWGPAVNFDGPGSDGVRRFVLDNAAMWVRDYHMDGLRLDDIGAILDRSATHIVEEIVATVRGLSESLGRKVVVIVETSLNDPRVIAPREKGGFGADAQWNDDFHHALHTLLTGERYAYYADYHGLPDLVKAMRDAYILDGRHSVFRDQCVGRPAGALSGHRFLAYAQTHDQAGNRPCGERLSHIAGLRKAKLAAALVFMSPYVPMLFQGEEWAASAPFPYFTDFHERQLGEAVRKGRAEMLRAWGWRDAAPLDPQAAETWMRARLGWDEVERPPHREMLDWHRRLIAIRRRFPCLADGDRSAIEVRCDEAGGWFVMRRGDITLACNFSDQARSVPLFRASGEVLLATDDVKSAGEHIRLPAWSAAVLAQATP